jgi:RND family efflux transporter MFP subunit
MGSKTLVEFAVFWLAAALSLNAMPAWAQSAQTAPAGGGALAWAPVEFSADANATAFDGVVEAVRFTIIAAQVSGAVVDIRAKVGEAVRAGDVLLRIDARSAEQSAAAGEAQVQAARASLEVVSQEYERQRQLFAKSYISQAAFERAQAQFKATQAQVNAQRAQAGVARTQSDFYIVHAPYAGIVADVPVTVGDMAMPGRTLLNLYDPSALRVTARVPQSVARMVARDPRSVAIEIPGLPGPGSRWNPARLQVLPTADPGTHTVEVRLELPPKLKYALPGMFARAWFAAGAAADGPVDGSAQTGAGVARLFVPTRAVVRRAEMTGLYILDGQGRAQLRQVRLGPVSGAKIEVLSGVAADERVALDPQAAAR